MSATTTASEKENIGKAIGRIASGVYVATVEDQGQPHGILLTWVSQAGFEPPAVCFAVNATRPILATLQPGKPLTINVLADGKMDVFKAFAAPGKEEHERFGGLPLAEVESCAPVFAEAVAYLDCRITGTTSTGGDHVLVLANIVGGQVLSDAKPMVHLRKNGFNY